jgi:hypothetical protein
MLHLTPVHIAELLRVIQAYLCVCFPVPNHVEQTALQGRAGPCSKVVDTYHNLEWYHGYSEIQYPSRERVKKRR